MSELGECAGVIGGLFRQPWPCSALRGTYVITTACSGTTNARLVLSQYQPGAPVDPVHFSEAFACAEPSGRALDLRAGSVTVDVINLSPGGSTWGTGAFANVHITPWKP